jgi:hypothetical protein
MQSSCVGSCGGVVREEEKEKNETLSGRSLKFLFPFSHDFWVPHRPTRKLLSQ